MKLSEIPGPTLKYGDRVKIKDENSKYAGMEGKVVSVSSGSARIKFEGMKKPISVMIDALEGI